MSEDKEQNKEIDTPSEKNDGSHPGEEIKEDDYYHSSLVVHWT